MRAGLSIDSSADRFVATLRPDVFWVRALALIGLVLVGGTLSLAIRFPSDAAWVSLICAACATAFPLALWLGLRRSFYRLTLDFVARTIQVEDVRSFDAPLVFTAELQAIRPIGEGDNLVLQWIEDPETMIVVPLGSQAEVEAFVSRIERIQAEIGEEVEADGGG